jgi:hypothetical protein
MSINGVALKKAIALLEAIKADYAIKFDGQKIGRLEIKDTSVNQAIKHNYQNIYRPVLKTLKAGQVHRWNFDEDKAKAFRSAVTSAATKAWGKESYLSSVTKTDNGSCAIEILRIK